MAWWGWALSGWVVGVVTALPTFLVLMVAWGRMANWLVLAGIIRDPLPELLPPPDPRRPTFEQEEKRKP